MQHVAIHRGTFQKYFDSLDLILTIFLAQDSPEQFQQ